MSAWTPENASAMRDRIKRAKSAEDIARLERSMDRLWNVGAFKSKEAMDLYGRIMDRACSLEMERGEG